MSQSEKQKANKKCSKCQEFWGNQSFGGLCSGCYKKQHGTDSVPSSQSNPQNVKVDATEKYQGQKRGEQQQKDRCFQCRKKVGLLGTTCKCDYVFCNNHRLHEDHSCTYNYEAEGKDNLKKEIKRIEHGKLQGEV